MASGEDETVLDRAHAAMAAAPGDDAARLSYFGHLADGELLLWLEAEPVGQDFCPMVLALEDGPVVLAFDREDRLAAAAPGPVPYAALPGRVIAAALAGQGVSLGINLGVAPSAFLVPPEALEWLARTLSHAPVAAEARPEAFRPPGALPPGLIAALEARLARAAGAVGAVLIAGVDYAGGRRGHLLAFVDAAPAGRDALARAVSEALTFSGAEAGELDVVFLDAQAPSLPALARMARALSLPVPAPTEPQVPSAPGSDPDRPPRLR